MTKGMEAARFRQLLEQLRDEGKTQTQIAALVGIDQTLVSKIINGQRDAGLNSISKAAERLGLDREFFFGTVDGVPNYRDYLTSARPKPRAAESRVDTADADDSSRSEGARSGASRSASRRRRRSPIPHDSSASSSRIERTTTRVCSRPESTSSASTSHCIAGMTPASSEQRIVAICTRRRSWAMFGCG